jgi:hypothetical protein
MEETSLMSSNIESQKLKYVKKESVLEKLKNISTLQSSSLGLFH